METDEDGTSLQEWLTSHNLGDRLQDLKILRSLPVEAVDDEAHDAHQSIRALLDAAFTIIDRSRILVLSHEGKQGRVFINQMADRLLRPALDNGAKGRFFHGQQVLLERNHPDLDLYNGDLGLVVRTDRQGLKAVFRRGNRYKAPPVERLTGLEPAYAMTVHKSQGSEFDEVLLVVPGYDSPLLSRRIIYTALTRARRVIKIIGSRERLAYAISVQEIRPGGVVL
jgi:exodeoxyribonuclease V alpha subunit